MRFTRAGEGFCDDAALKVSGVDDYIRTRGDQVSRESVHIEFALSIRKIPEQVHAGNVDLDTVILICAGEVVSEIVADFSIVDLDIPTREVHITAVATGYGYTQNMLLEPGIIRDDNVQLGKIVVCDLDIDIFVHIAKIDGVACDMAAHVTKRFRLRTELAEGFAHIHIGSIGHTEIRAVIRVAQ